MSDVVTAKLPAKDFGETAGFYERPGFQIEFREED